MQNYDCLNLKVNASLKFLWYLQKLCIDSVKGSLENHQLVKCYKTVNFVREVIIGNTRLTLLFIFFVCVGMSYCLLIVNRF